MEDAIEKHLINDENEPNLILVSFYNLPLEYYINIVLNHEILRFLF